MTRRCRPLRAPARADGIRCTNDRGSSLMLMPAAVMVVLVLGAIAVDCSVVRLAHRDLLDVAASAANDAVTVGIDTSHLRTDGSMPIDLDRAVASVQRTIALHRLTGIATVRSVAIGPGPDQVTVELAMPVDYIFAKALPGSPHATTVHARATATAIRR